MAVKKENQPRADKPPYYFPSPTSSLHLLNMENEVYFDDDSRKMEQFLRNLVESEVSALVFDKLRKDIDSAIQKLKLQRDIPDDTKRLIFESFKQLGAAKLLALPEDEQMARIEQVIAVYSMGTILKNSSAGEKKIFRECLKKRKLF